MSGSLFRAIVCATLAALASSCAPGDAPARPGVLLITLDTTRADRLGCYGYPAPTTPRLDAFSRQGHRFETAIAQAAVTPVSHASILTGLYPYRHGLRVLHGNAGHRLPETTVTLAERLREEGYATGAFVSAFPVTEYFGLHQGFDTFDASFMTGPLSDVVSSAGTVSTGMSQRRAGETTDLALDWLTEQRGPFLAWVHYFDPHDVDLLPPGVDPMDYEGKSLPVALRELYDVEMRYMDGEIGRLLDALDADEALRDTIVVVVADHGEGLGDHGWWTHGLLYQEQIRVPLIVRASGIAPGVSSELVRTIDIVPTLHELLGIDGAEDLDGRSLVAQMHGLVPAPTTAYADSINTGLTYQIRGVTENKDDIHYAWIDPPWKYIHHVLRPEESELFDLAADPGERNNLLRARQDIGVRLLRQIPREAFAEPGDPADSALDDEARERLRSLGYVN